MSIGKKIIELRESQGLTQSMLAEKININRSVLNRIELESRPIRADELKLIADFFHVSTDYLLGRDESAPESEERPHVKKIDSLPQDTAPINDLVSELFADRPDVCALLKNGVYANKNGTLVKTDLSDLPPSAKENLRNNILFVLESTGYLPKK